MTKCRMFQFAFLAVCMTLGFIMVVTTLLALWLSIV